MTTPYRAPEAPTAPRVRYEWTLVDLPDSDSLAWIIAWTTVAELLSWPILAGCFIGYGAAPFVLRWAAVNVVATALWCLAFVRREVRP